MPDDVIRRQQIVRGKGGGKGGGGSGGGQEQPNSLRSIALARFVDVISEGPVYGPWNVTTPMNSVLLNGTPVMQHNGVKNFAGLSMDWRLGTAQQTPYTGIPDVESTTEVNIQVQTAVGPVTATIEPGDFPIDQIWIMLEFPALNSLDASTGVLSGTSVRFQIWYAAGDDDLAMYSDETIDGKCTSPYQRQYAIPTNGVSGPYQVQIIRITPDSNSASLANQLYWISYTQVTNLKMQYPFLATAALSIDSSQFGQQVPIRAYDWGGIICKVPSNRQYDFTSGEVTYTPPIWDGTFKDEWCDNPAWCTYDMLTSQRYGLGQDLDPQAIDKWSFYTAGQYCDELVPDGFGAQERRFTINMYMQTQQDAYSVINSMCSIFRGMAYWSAGGISVSIDMPKNVTRVVTNSQVVDGTFEYVGPSSKARINFAKVTWNNPDLSYKHDIEPYMDPEAVIAVGMRETNVTAIGCTSQGQAQRYGHWLVDVAQTSDEAVKFTGGLEFEDLKPGEVIAIADQDYMGGYYGGRLKPSTTSQLFLDRAVTIGVNGGDTQYQVWVGMPDGTIEKVNITNSSEVTNALNLEAALPQVPQNMAPWILFDPNVEPRQFQVISNLEKGRGVREIMAMFYDPARYGRVDFDINLNEEPIYSQYTGSSQLPAPQNLAVQLSNVVVNGLPQNMATVSWTASADPRVITYTCWVVDPNKVTTQLGDTRDVTIEFPYGTLGDWNFYIYGTGTNNQVTPTVSIAFNANGNATGPDDPTDLRASSGQANQITVTWTGATASDIAEYDLYTSQIGLTDPNIIEENLIYSGKATTFVYTGLGLGQQWYFWLRAKNFSGLYGDLIGPALGFTSLTATTPPGPGTITFDMLNGDLATAIGTVFTEDPNGQTVLSLLQGAVASLSDALDVLSTSSLMVAGTVQGALNALSQMGVNLDYYTGAVTNNGLSESITTLNQQTGQNAAGLTSLSSTVTTNNTAVTTQITQLTSTVTSNNTTLTSTIQSLSQTVSNNQSTTATTLTSLQSQITGNNTTLTSSIGTLSQTVANNQSTTATTLTSLQSQITNNNSTLTSSINNLSQTVSTNQSTQATQISTLQSQMAGTTGSALNSSITNLSATVTNNQTSTATQLSSLQSQITTNNNTLNSSIQSLADVTTNLANGTSLATQINNLSTTVGSNTASISTQATSINGLQAQYTVKVDVNGHVAGFGLASVANNGTVTSAFEVRADAFYIVDPASPSTAPAAFSFTTGGTPLLQVNGYIIANNIITGTLDGETINMINTSSGATQAVTVALDGVSGRISCWDNSGQIRAVIGTTFGGGNQSGLYVYNSSGTQIFSADGLGVNVVGTLNINGGSVTVPAFGSFNTTHTGNGYFTNWITVITVSVTVAVNSWVYIIGNLQQTFSATGKSWALALGIDNVDQITTGGASNEIAPMLSCGAFLTAGTHQVEFLWSATDSTVATVSGTLQVIGGMR